VKIFILFQLCGAKLSEGVFVGTFLSMSSTAVVIMFVQDGYCSIRDFRSLHFLSLGCCIRIRPLVRGNAVELLGLAQLYEPMLTKSDFHSYIC
jgi:hypothetical protein